MDKSDKNSDHDCDIETITPTPIFQGESSEEVPSASTSNSSNPSKKFKQTDLQGFISANKPVSTLKQRNLDNQLIKMIVKEYHPFSLVEDSEFRTFIKMLCPGYSIPSRKTVSNSLIPQLYLSTMEKIKILMSNVDAL